MCGILGVVFRDPQQAADEQQLAQARDTLTHRGPDEAGLWIRPGVGFAHRRLSVLDLGHGQQPMVSDDQQHAIIYNGEVYNYRALMRDYGQRGLSFETTCDTELVFKALVADGPNATDRFHGMFGLGYYSVADRKLLLVRDRLGQKPVYWHDTGEALIFASELKAILAWTGGRYDVDPAALEQFYTRGYVLSPRTIFTGIHKLPAGHRLILDAGTWSVRIEQWWDAEPIAAEELCELSDGAVVDELDALLSRSVADRMISDVPIGTLLSGGIDSSLITAMASKAIASSGDGEGVKAYTIGFDESDAHNEMPYAEMVAKQYGCDWRPRNVRGDDGAWLQELDETAAFYDEPFGNFTVLAQRKLAQLCREELVVVLSGQGGDELSGGYPGRYNWVMQTEQAAANVQARSQYAPAVDDVANHLGKTSFLRWPGAQDRMFGEGVKRAMIDAAPPTDGIAPFWNRHRWPDRLGNVLYTDAKTNLADYLICIEERATMSCSLEARNPMLDHRVVRFMLSLPGRFKARPGSGPMSANGLQNKWALHALAGRYLPKEAFDRPKRGFTPPIQRWIAHNADAIAGVFRETDGVTASLYSVGWREYLLAGRYETGATMPVYYCLMFALWMRRYGKHVRSIPGGDRGVRIEERGAQPDMWHETYRTQSPEAMATARWFCQALRNFSEGDAIRLVGDDGGFYRWLAEQSGLRIADRGEAKGTVLIGLEAMQSLVSADEIDGTTLLLFVPFTAAQQPEVHAALQATHQTAPIQGHQAMPVGGDRGVLIARCAVGVTAG